MFPFYYFRPISTLMRSLQQPFSRFYTTLPSNYRPYQIERDMWQEIQGLVKEATPLAVEIMNRVDLGGMSIGALSPLTHRHLQQTAMALAGARTYEEYLAKYYATDYLITSNCGEGNDIHDHLVKQLASARFGVDLWYVLKAAILQFKAAQGVKPGTGGAISWFKVTEFIAWLRHCTPGTDLYSPGPHADQLSIEDLSLLLKAYLLANPNASPSVKLASEPGVGTIALGCLKAMGLPERVNKRPNIEITGKGSTGNTPLFTKYHSAFPWLVGLAKTHATLVASGLRDNVTLTASGGFVGSFFAPFLWGADKVSIGTMALIGDGCIMVRKCHDNTCPKGVATQDDLLIAKNTGSPLSIARVILAASELTALEMRPYFAHVSQAVGRAADVLTAIDDGPLTGHEKYLDLLKTKPRFISLTQLPRHPGPSYQEKEIIESIRMHQKTRFTVKGDNADNGFGARLSASTINSDIKEIVHTQGIYLKMTGFPGQNFAILGAPGITYDAGDVHTNDSTGKSLSGAKVFAKTCGNQTGFGMTEGLIATRGVGSRGAVRKSGGRFLTECAGAFFANFHTKGTTFLLGYPSHYEELVVPASYKPPFAYRKLALGFGFLSGFSGGEIILPRLLWQEALELQHVSPTIRNQVTVHPLTDADARELIKTLEESVKHIKSVLQQTLLDLIKKFPEFINRWFIKLIPPVAKAMNVAIGQIALAEESLPPLTRQTTLAKSIATPQTANASMVIPPDRDKAACGTSLVMNLDQQASHEIVQLGIGALKRSEHRGAGGADALSGDGCGLMLYFGEGFFEKQPECKHVQLTYGRFGIMVVFMPKDAANFTLLEEKLADSLRTFGLTVTVTRHVPINEEKLGVQARADELQLMHYIIAVPEGHDLRTFDRQLALAHLNFEFTAQQLPMPHQAHVCSVSRRCIVYKTKGKEKHIADIYPDLRNPALTASVVMGHARFATNTDTLIESVQPLSIAMFNGEINNLRRFIEEIKYHPTFSQLIGVNLRSIDFTVYSDSYIMACYMKMLHLLGYNAENIHNAIFHPYEPAKKNPVAEFHDLIGMPGLEGPNGSIRVYEDGEELGIYIETDTMGWRPHRGIIDSKRRLFVSGSELGIVPDLEGDLIELDAGEALTINPQTGHIALFKNTAETEQFFTTQLANIPQVAQEEDEDSLFVMHDTELQERKLRASITPEIEKSILSPMFNEGKGFTVSMGDDGGDEVTVSGPSRFVNTLKTHFAQITRPPLDDKREGEMMSGITFIGAKTLPEDLYRDTCHGVRVNNPILNNKQMHFLTTSKVKTELVPCIYPVRGREIAMHAALKKVVEQSIAAAKNGTHVIILSDKDTDSVHAPILPTIVAGIVDLALRTAGLRHKVTLCLQSSICVTPLEQIAALSVGANIINPYLIFVADKIHKTSKNTFTYQRESYQRIALQEILAAAARAGIRTLSAGYQGARQISALGLDQDVANSLGIYTELGGFDWANIAAAVVDMHTRPTNLGKYHYEGQASREGKWNAGLVTAWREIAKGKKTLTELLSTILSNIKKTERDNIEGWFKKKPPMIWTPENPMPICMIGAGAACFMLVDALLKSSMGKKIKIHLIEENPANLFGMVKDGIAPDKLLTKQMQFKLLSQCLNDSRVKYYGGLKVSRHDEHHGDVSLEALVQDYPCVIDCSGAPHDKVPTEIIGCELLIPASKVWKAYNGFFDPLNPNRYWPFSEHTRSQVKIVIGNGNVAADIIRLLLTPPERLNNTQIHPTFYQRLRKQGPSLIRNIAHRSVIQCKISLKELESFEKNGIQVRASFDEKGIDEASLSDEQLKKLQFFRRAKQNSSSTILIDQTCVHFHFDCKPQKITKVGRNILEMEVLNQNGETEHFRGGDIIAAIGKNPPEEKLSTVYRVGWASGSGGNLVTIQESVAKNAEEIIKRDEQRGFDHLMGPAPERPWQSKASVSNQECLNILAYFSSGQQLDTTEQWYLARSYHPAPAAPTTETNTGPQTPSLPPATNKSGLTVVNRKTNTATSVPVGHSDTTKTIYSLLLQASKQDPTIPVPENECGEAGTCMRCVATLGKPIPQKPFEKSQLSSLYGQNGSTFFLTCQHVPADAIDSGQSMEVIYPSNSTS